MMADEKHPDVVHSAAIPDSVSLEDDTKLKEKLDDTQRELQDLKSRLLILENEGPDQRKADSRHQRHWYPWITFVVLMNFFLWFSMIYSVQDARAWSFERSHYLAYSWIIFFIPLAVGAFLLFSPFPGPLKRSRTQFTSRVPSGLYSRAMPHFNPLSSVRVWPARITKLTIEQRPIALINLLNALACFAFVVGYLYYSGIPVYNTPVWETGIDFSAELPIPAIALMFPIADGTSGSTTGGASLHAVPQANGSVASAIAIYNKTQEPFPTEAISVFNLRDQYNAIVFNSSMLKAKDFATIQDRLYISLDVHYNSSTIGTAIGDVDAATLMTFEMFDPRLSLETVFDCELAKYPLMPALAHNNFLVSVDYITDNYGLVISPSATLKCGKQYHQILAQEDPAYASYTWALESSIQTAANLSASCDIAINPNNVCRSSMSISFGSHLVRSNKSVPGKSHLDIWLNAGAITGTIQFFAWFVEILVT